MEFERNPTLDALCARKSVRVFTEAVSYTHLDVYKRQGHRCARGELVAGRDIRKLRAAGLQSVQRHAVPVHRHEHRAHAVVAQHLRRAGLARIFHRKGAGAEQPGQQAHQIFDARAHHDLLGRCLLYTSRCV